MPIEFQPLPYALNALEPHVSADTLYSQYTEFHRHCIDTLNACIAGSEFANATLEEIVRGAQGSLSELAAQAWNQTLYWQSLRPRGGGEPSGPLGEKIAQAFGSAAGLRQEFERAGLALFGSGWLWLVQRPDDALAVVVTRNAATPATGNDTVLLACSLWEHAYYLDHQNNRAAYLAAFWKLVNWDFAASRMR